MQTETIWEFSTARLRVAFEVSPCEDDPADSFQFDEDVAAVRDGRVEWFNAHVAVYDKGGRELGRDVLCGCAYATVREFYTSHRDPDPQHRNCSAMRAVHGSNVSICHYFPDMVASACREARATLARLRSIPVRV